MIHVHDTFRLNVCILEHVGIDTIDVGAQLYYRKECQTLGKNVLPSQVPRSFKTHLFYVPLVIYSKVPPIIRKIVSSFYCEKANDELCP